MNTYSAHYIGHIWKNENHVFYITCKCNGKSAKKTEHKFYRD